VDTPSTKEMKPELREQVAQLHRAALEREESERAAFLEQACGGDEELRQALLSLLAYEGKTAAFMESPALPVAAKQLPRGEVDAGASRSNDSCLARSRPAAIEWWPCSVRVAWAKWIALTT
jgi:hypothetical protein